MLSSAACASLRHGTARTLDVYVIDVEGGKAVLAHAPNGQSMLLDAGFPGDGTFNSQPGPPERARDAQRILAAARDAGVTRIDYFVSSHYHADHLGGVLELAQLLPIGTFVDHAAPAPVAETNVPGTLALYDAYSALRAKGKHVRPAPGDRLTLGDVQATVVAIDSAVTPPLAGAGRPNAACTGTGVPAQEATENPRSLAVVLEYGRFRLLDPGDLTGAPLFALGCPVDRVGRVDAYVVAHHGGGDAADPSLFAAIRPLVALVSNGPRKGAQPPTLETIRNTPSVDGWQIHTTLNPGAPNVPDERIANLDETTSAWIKLSARRDGSFTVTNGRTGWTKAYRRPALAYSEVVAGCGGGFSGGSSGAALLPNGALYRWQRTLPAAPEQRTLVRTDTALAADVYRRLAAMRFAQIEHAESGNMTCFVRATTDAGDHEVSWPSSDTKAPSEVRALFDRLQGAIR